MLHPILLPVLAHTKDETCKEKFVANERTTNIRGKDEETILINKSISKR
jgi:hypothetical protein